MTNDKISRADWDSVVEIAAELTNCVVNGGSDGDVEECQKRLAGLLKQLETKYGARSEILATRAEYTVDLQEKLRLFEAAYATALGSNWPESVSITSSLARLYIEEVRCVKQGELWLNRLSLWLDIFPDDFERKELSNLRLMIKKI